MSDLRDYRTWHREYDDPHSALSWRLGQVQQFLTEELDRRPGEVRVLSACSGDGRDIIDVLAARHDATRVSATLLEVHPEIAQAARDRAAAAGLSRIEVRTTDAGSTDAYAGAVPDDLVLLVGIFGNISDQDLWRTVDAAPGLCRPGATLIWSRGIDEEDLNDLVRARFTRAGFVELHYDAWDGETSQRDTRPALGAVRYFGEPSALLPRQRLFTFLR